MSAPQLILASQSPRRSQLLQMIGLRFDVCPADVDETYRPGEDPSAHAERLAREKAWKVGQDRPDAIVIGSDTVVILDGEVLGKPATTDEAVATLMKLQGRRHTVATGIALCTHGVLSSGVERVSVEFTAFDEGRARAYAETGEPMDKAGAYGIQGYGATIVQRIDGDFFAVMGFPLVRFIDMLRAIGWEYDFHGLRQTGPSSRGRGSAGGA